MITKNRIELVGNVGSDPRVKYLEPTTCRATFTLATDTNHVLDEWGRKHDGKEVDWHYVVCFHKLAEWVEMNVTSGILLHVEGRLSYSTLRSPSGQSKRIAYVIADSIQSISAELVPFNLEHKDKTEEQPTDPYGLFMGDLEQDNEGLPF